MFNYFNKTDTEVKQDVLNELMWDPSVNSGQVKVSAKNGVVSLTGSVPHYIEKLAAERAARRVGGVRAVVDELEVKGLFDKNDEEIAAAALSALKWNYSAPKDVKVTVSHGWIDLDGEAEWDYQRNAAQYAVSELLGVRGVSNRIKLKSAVQPSDIKTRIEEALKRSAEAEGRKINVTVKEDRVILSGKVHSISESEDVRLAAWKAPGVRIVENNLTISQ
jgi:osmotically-inducible protein OsmY